MKNQYDKKKKNLPKILINFMEINKKIFFFFSNEKSIYDKKEKSYKNTHKFHEN